MSVVNLDRFPRAALCHRPTPLERMDRLADHLGGPRLWVKRDDCTGLALGGNKTRKLEFLLGEALAEHADTVVTIGGVQSNHCRQTAAAAARLGLRCELLLPHLSRFGGANYQRGGNVLLDRLFGATLHLLDADAVIADRTREVLDAIRARGEKSYFIPAGGSTALGALGYVDAAIEVADQAREQGIAFDHIFVTTGSCTTHAGLAVGLSALRQAGQLERLPNLQGVSVYHRREAALGTVRQKARETAALLNLVDPNLESSVQVTDEYLGGGYGEPTDAMLEAVSLVARLEGLLVDPVYTGKTLSGLIDGIRQGRFTASDQVLFWHTGGTPALFAYDEALAPLTTEPNAPEPDPPRAGSRAG